MRIRSNLVALAAAFGAAACGTSGAPRGADAPQATAPDWQTRYVRGSAAGLAKARAAGCGAMLVVSATW